MNSITPWQFVLTILGVEILSAPIIIFVVTYCMAIFDKLFRKFLVDILTFFVKFVDESAKKKEK